MNRKQYKQQQVDQKGFQKQKLEEVIESQRRKGMFSAKISLKNVAQPRLEARTDMRTKETQIGYAESYASEHPTKVFAFARDAAAHEINHHTYNGVHNGYEFQGCPRNVNLATRLIFEPILDILSKKGFSHGDAEYVENALEDSVLQSDLSPAFKLNGIAHFFDETGKTSPKGIFTPFYEAHVRLNLMLWGNKRQKKSLEAHFTDDKETGKKIKEVLDEFMQSSGLRDLNAGFSVKKSSKTLSERERIRSYLNDENKWSRIASAYAEAFSKLMAPSYALPLLNHSGAGTKGREKEDSSKDGNEFQIQRKEREYKRGRIQEAHSKSKGSPAWIEKFEAMDLLYEGLAKKLAIEAKTFVESDRMPILHYGERKFNPSSDSIKNITFGFDSKAQIELRKRPYSIDLQYPVKESTMGFPRARFIVLDTSGSMASDFNDGSNIGSTAIVPWGDRSKYHGALVEEWGFLEWLKEAHLLEKTGLDLANFSEKTIVGKGLEQAKRVALTPQFGNTNLDMSAVNYMFEGRGNFIMTISDGAIQNWASIKEQYLKGVKNNYYVHLQLGAGTEATQDIRKAGGHVECISTPEELRGRTIILADKFYRSYAK